MTGSLKKLGLALGGGGLLGISHIGVLEVLEEHNISPEVITGTSVGSFVAALYASGIRPDALRSLAMNIHKENLFDMNLNPVTFMRLLVHNILDLISFFDVLPRGLISGVKLAGYVDRVTRNKSLSQIQPPIGLVAADLISGNRVVFTNRLPLREVADTIFIRDAPLSVAVRASTAIPGAFEPVRWQDTLLCDGGLVEMVPASVARLLGAQVVLAVNLGSRATSPEPNSLIQVIMRGIGVMSQQGMMHQLACADLVLNPVSTDIGLADYDQIPALLARGRAAAETALPQLIKVLVK
jgi:NTE family protein